MAEILYRKKNKTGYITLNRPEALNAIDLSMRKRLCDLWQEINNDADVLSVIITGAGKRAFSAGADVKEVEELRKDNPAADLPLDSLDTYCGALKKPAIAAINGLCIGSAFVIALNCDFRIASENASFLFPEVKVAMPPIYGAYASLPKYLPPAIVNALVLLGDPLTARDAHRFGLVNEVVPPAKLMSTAESYAARLNALSPLMVAAIKYGLNVSNAPSPQLVALSENIARATRFSQDAREGLAAFTSKRKPVWKGK